MMNATDKNLRIGTLSVVLLHDAVIGGLSFYLAHLLRLGGIVHTEAPLVLVYGSLISAMLVGAISGIAGLHRSLWLHTSIDDVKVIIAVSSLVVLILLPTLFLIDRLTEVPRSVPLIQWLLLLVMLGGPRIAYRLWCERHSSQQGGEPIILAGSADVCALLARAFTSTHSVHRPAAIIDVESLNAGRRILGIQVFAGTDPLQLAVSQIRSSGVEPKRLVFAGNVDARVLRRLMVEAEALHLPTAKAPNLADLDAAVEAGRIELRPVPLLDLLRRPQVSLDAEAVRELIRGRRILVTGAGGSIGSELVRQIAECSPSCLLLLDNCEFNLYSINNAVAEKWRSLERKAILADVRDGARIRAVFERHRPEFVFHAAALKHVPLVEEHPVEGAWVNVLGTRNVADAAWSCGALAMVQISTDKAVQPTSLMGATKRLAEFYCQTLDITSRRAGEADPTKAYPRFVTVRFGNVLGSSGSVIPLFQAQIAAGGPLTVTHPEMRRYFMTIREASELVLHATVYGLDRPADRGAVFVLDMGEPVRIVDVARQMIRLAGREPDEDVKIDFVGLRPGEKLDEELFDPAEERLQVRLPGVSMARSRHVAASHLRRAFTELTRACEAGDDDAVRNLLARIVPGFTAAPRVVDQPPSQRVA